MIFLVFEGCRNDVRIEPLHRRNRCFGIVFGERSIPQGRAPAESERNLFHGSPTPTSRDCAWTRLRRERCFRGRVWARSYEGGLSQRDHIIRSEG